MGEYDDVAFDAMNTATANKDDKLTELEGLIKSVAPTKAWWAERLTTEKDHLLKKMIARGEDRDALRSEKSTSLMGILENVSMYLTDYGRERKVNGRFEIKPYSKEEKSVSSKALENIRGQIYSEKRKDFDLLLKNYQETMGTRKDVRIGEKDDYHVLREFLEKNISYEPWEGRNTKFQEQSIR